MRARFGFCAAVVMAGCRCAGEPPPAPTAPATSTASPKGAEARPLQFYLAAKVRTRMASPFNVMVDASGDVFVSEETQLAKLEATRLSALPSVPAAWGSPRAILGRFPGATRVVTVSDFIGASGFELTLATWTGSAWSPLVSRERYERADLGGVVTWGDGALALVTDLSETSRVSRFRRLGPGASAPMVPNVPDDESPRSAVTTSAGTVVLLGTPRLGKGYFLREYAAGDAQGKRLELLGLERCGGKSWIATRGASVLVAAHCEGKAFRAAWLDGGTWRALEIPEHESATSLTSVAVTDDGPYITLDGKLLHFRSGAWSTVAMPAACDVIDVWGGSALFADCIHENDARLYTTLAVVEALDFGYGPR